MKTALIVDDSRLARLTLKRLISKHDINVVESEGVEEALLWLEYNSLPDVIFLDVMMPKIDGFEGLTILKNNERTKSIPVVMYSGDTSEAARTKAREGGASGYLPKPAENSRVDHLIEVLSKRTKPQPENFERVTLSMNEEKPVAIGEPVQMAVMSEPKPVREASVATAAPAKQSSASEPNTNANNAANEFLQGQLEQLVYRLEMAEKKITKLENEMTKDQRLEVNHSAERDVAFLQRKLTSAEKRVNLSIAIAAVSFVVAAIAVIVNVLN
ncbi:response regulator [Rappaport israeli]|uniref:response regulator n=1 Tax=Rappaport israeli TaxID=1839807 RepID=UPI000931C607|nr:response regulator [Rappaport israeli]